MRSFGRSLNRRIAVCLMLLAAVLADQARSASAQQPVVTQPPPEASSPQGKGETQVTKASTEASTSSDTLPDSPTPVSQQASGQNQQSGTPEPATSQQNGAGRSPVGTAAAPYEKTLGVAASRPAGAAIASAKQRRVRVILISVGVIAGAAIAGGTVAALSHASPGRP